MTTPELHAELKASLERTKQRIEGKPYWRPMKKRMAAPKVNHDIPTPKKTPCAVCGKNFKSKRTGTAAICGPCGGHGGMPKQLDDDVVGQMVILRENGWVLIRIAEQFHVSERAVRQYLRDYHDARAQSSRESAGV